MDNIKRNDSCVGPYGGPTEIARETLRRLAARRITPTPDNYRELYHEIVGLGPTANDCDSNSCPRALPQKIAAGNPENEPAGAAPLHAPENNAGVAARAELSLLKKSDGVAKPRWESTDITGAEAAADDARIWSRLLRELSEHIAADHPSRAVHRKIEQLDWVLKARHPSLTWLQAELSGLMKSWPVSAAKVAMPPADSQTMRFRDVLAQLLESAIVANIGQSDDLVQEGKQLAQRVRKSSDDAAASELADELRRYCAKLELQSETNTELRSGVLRLLRLLVDNISELMVDESWVSGQLQVVRDIIAHPDNVRVIDDAERYLKEVMLRQGVIKHSIQHAKSTLKAMVTKFIDRLGEFSDDTGQYHAKIKGYSQRIRAADKIEDLDSVLDDLLRDTRQMQEVTERSRDEIVIARDRATAAERKIRELESDLARVTEKVREDQLTGTLNRRGLDDAFRRESVRAQRQAAPLCAALLDLDDFKQLNDTYGHSTGDDALLHFVKVMRETMRPTDVICRFGGEEFLLLLPDTGLDDAVQVMVRLQRQLTRRFFLHNNERVLITFSAGVTPWKPGETQEVLLTRADQALYKAKNTGKNRALAAD